MARCARCGGFQPQEMVDVTMAGDSFRRMIPGRHEECTSCGWRGNPVEFRRYRMDGPLKFITSTLPSLATWLDDPSVFPETVPYETATVYAGPPAHLPTVPTPDDLLRSAGLGHLVVKPDPVYDPDDDYDLDEDDW